jgi:hypothetical protein
MICKYLERSLSIMPDMQQGESMKPLQLEYYIIETDTAHSDEESCEKTFGIEIIKKENSGYVENEAIADVFCNREKAEYVLDMLARNTATPMELKFVLEDMVGTFV